MTFDEAIVITMLITVVSLALARKTENPVRSFILYMVGGAIGVAAVHTFTG